MKAGGKKIWKGLSGIAFVFSAMVLGLGLDKMFNYNSGEYFPYEYHNAYVGGDAYNYIINGNYATGFFVLAAMFALMGVGFIALYYLSKIADGQSGYLVGEKPGSEAEQPTPDVDRTADLPDSEEGVARKADENRPE